MIESESKESVCRERFTLRKSAKLRHRTLVQDLFKKGKSVYSGPLRVTFRPLTDSDLTDSFQENVPDMIAPVQMMITVPKKKRRHAVDRVLMRRRIREAFRLQYHGLRRCVEASHDMRTLSVAIVYMQSENCDMSVIHSAMSSILAKIVRKLSSVHDPGPASENDGVSDNHKTEQTEPLL